MQAGGVVTLVRRGAQAAHGVALAAGGLALGGPLLPRADAGPGVAGEGHESDDRSGGKSTG